MPYALRKTIQFLLTLWAAVTVNFLLPRLMPGSPTDAALAKIASTGQVVTDAQRRAIELQLGSPSGSVFSQYFAYLNNVVHLQFGVSYTDPTQPVIDTIRQALPWTLVLIGFCTVFQFVIGTLLGVLAGWRRGRGIDTTLTLSTTFAGAFPPFWAGLLLLYVFAFKFRWWPLGGGYTDGLTPSLNLTFLGDAAAHSILPALTLVITGMGGWVLGMRNNMISTLGEDYVTFAEANGLRTRTVALRYAARNALLPPLTSFGLTLAAVVGGSVLVEGVFSYPGVGLVLYRAVSNRDYPLMQALFLIITVTTLVAIYLVDMLYVRLDPRVRR